MTACGPRDTSARWAGSKRKPCRKDESGRRLGAAMDLGRRPTGGSGSAAPSCSWPTPARQAHRKCGRQPPL
eukprot:2825768-Lingulodinium_polyedra.AAC.1